MDGAGPAAHNKPLFATRGSGGQTVFGSINQINNLQWFWWQVLIQNDNSRHGQASARPLRHCPIAGCKLSVLGILPTACYTPVVRGLRTVRPAAEALQAI